jgi:membrane fusion protein, macrolide-specific efflux system
MTEELPLSDEDELTLDSRSRWRKHRIAIVIAAVVVVGAATGLTLWLTSSTPATGLVVSTQTVSVTSGQTMKQTVATSGTIEPATSADLNFAVSGTVTAVDVKAGQTVTVGQVLATVSTTALNAQVEAAQAQLASAQDRLDSDESSSAATATIDSDEAAVTSAESSLTSAQTDLADASLTSTIAGTVASVSLTVGQQVSGTGTGSGGTGGTGEGASSAAAASSDASSSSTGQVVVIGTNSYIVNTTVDDTEVGQITDNDQATITPTGATTPDYGTVASVGLIGTQSSDVTTFPVVIDVTGDPSGLYPGSTAAVAIIVKQLNNVTEVPTAAITYTTSGQAQVTQLVGGKHVTRSVTVGQAESGETQITSGVAGGDKVLERTITFKGVTGGGAGLFGGTGGTTGRRTFGGGGGGFGGGTGGFTGGGAGFGGAGG